MTAHHHIFPGIVSAAKIHGLIVVAVVYPLSDVALRGVVEAADHGLIKPVLIGPAGPIRQLANERDLPIDAFEILDSQSEEEASALGVALCRSGKAEALMKGSLHTDHLMHAVMQKESGLRTRRRVSHVFVLDVPTYPRMILITDAAVNISPGLEDKADIVRNAIDLAHILGLAEPRVAILSAVETVTSKIGSTIDAAALCKMADRGQITGAILDGPLAFDNAISLKSARMKHIHSPVAGKADVLVVPNLESGNMLAKQLEYLADAEAAGIVLGALVPIILTSRADSAKSRMASCAIAALVAHQRRGNQVAETSIAEAAHE